MGKMPVAIEITKDALDNTFDNCEIYGKVKIAGSGTKIIKTKIYQFREAHPFVWWLGIIASIITIIGFILQVL